MPFTFEVRRHDLSYAKGALAGVAIETQFPAAKDPGVQIFEDSTSGVWYVKTLVAGVPTWESRGTSTAIPVDEIVYGTGVGIAGSTQLFWDPAKELFTAKDDVGAKIMETDCVSTGFHRNTQWYDPSGFRMFQIFPLASFRFVEFNYPTGIEMLIVEADTSANQFQINDQSGQTLVLANANFPGQRDFRVVGDNAVAQFYVDTKQIDGRPIQAFAEDASLVMDIAAAVAVRAFNLKDNTSVAGFTAFLRSALRTLTFQDHSAIAMRIYNTLNASRTIQDLDQTGAQTHLTDLKSASKSETFGGVGAVAKMFVDLVALNFKALAADGVTVTALLDFATGSFRQKLTVTSGASPQTANTPCGRGAIKAGSATMQIVNSLILNANDCVKVSFIGVDATGLVPGLTAVAVGSFTVGTVGNCTADYPFCWSVTPAAP